MDAGESFAAPLSWALGALLQLLLSKDAPPALNILRGSVHPTSWGEGGLSFTSPLDVSWDSATDIVIIQSCQQNSPGGVII